jgi:hypothetical protein
VRYGKVLELMQSGGAVDEPVRRWRRAGHGRLRILH